MDWVSRLEAQSVSARRNCFFGRAKHYFTLDSTLTMTANNWVQVSGFLLQQLKMESRRFRLAASFASINRKKRAFSPQPLYPHLQKSCLTGLLSPLYSRRQIRER